MDKNPTEILINELDTWLSDKGKSYLKERKVIEVSSMHAKDALAPLQRTYTNNTIWVYIYMYYYNIIIF